MGPKPSWIYKVVAGTVKIPVKVVKTAVKVTVKVATGGK
jgi:hypothetical protein